MSEVKTASAWASTSHYPGIGDTTYVSGANMDFGRYDYAEPVVIVHGASESDILAGLSLLVKSREVCEWPEGGQGYTIPCLTERHGVCCTIKKDEVDLLRPCWCGRKVSIAAQRGEG